MPFFNSEYFTKAEHSLEEQIENMKNFKTNYGQIEMINKLQITPQQKTFLE